jgi:hypothetical protein
MQLPDSIPPKLGRPLSIVGCQGAKPGCFVADFAAAANKLSRREYRKPFVVPALTVR